MNPFFLIKKKPWFLTEKKCKDGPKIADHSGTFGAMVEVFFNEKVEIYL